MAEAGGGIATEDGYVGAIMRQCFIVMMLRGAYTMLA